jgi:hypothetical protein
MAISKVILNGNTLMDVTQDTVTADKLLQTYTATKNDGTKVTGTLVPQVAPTLQSKTVSPSTSQQTVSPDSGYDGLSQVTVNAMPSGSAGTPTATKGTVSSNSVTVTPSVTNTSGYISGGTINGTAVTVSASELVSGTKSITENGTGIDVANYAAVDVNVSGGGGGGSTLVSFNLSAGATGYAYYIDSNGTYNETKILPPAPMQEDKQFSQSVKSGTLITAVTTTRYSSITYPTNCTAVKSVDNGTSGNYKTILIVQAD